jgi:transcription antitermination factor NusG
LPEALPHPQWFALTVKRRYEKVVAHSLRRRGLEDFLPLYVMRRCWSDRIKAVEFPLFPGYVFCRFDYDRRLPVLCIPGVTSIVGYAKLPTPLSESEIASIRTILTSNLPAQPWPVVRAGQSIRIERGPLAGLQGMLIREKDSLRVVVSLDLLQRAVAVEVDRDIVCATSLAAESHSGEASLMV